MTRTWSCAAPARSAVDGRERCRLSGCTAMPGMSCASAVQRVSGPGSGCAPAPKQATPDHQTVVFCTAQFLHVLALSPPDSAFARAAQQ